MLQTRVRSGYEIDWSNPISDGLIFCTPARDGFLSDIVQKRSRSNAIEPFDGYTVSKQSNIAATYSGTNADADGSRWGSTTADNAIGDELTMACWIQHTGVVNGEPETMFNKNYSPTAGDKWFALVALDGAIHQIAAYFDDGTNANETLGPFIINDDKPHFIALRNSVSQGFRDVYVDGSSPPSAFPAIAGINNSGDWTLGGRFGGNVDRDYSGKIWNCMVWNRAVSDVELQDLIAEPDSFYTHETRLFAPSLTVVLVTVPDVVGLAQAAAESAITAEGLIAGPITTASSGTVPVGDVISQDPIGGSSVAIGSAVALVVSTGSATVAVPDVVGLAQAAAESAIASAGLTSSVTTSQSPTVPAGDVISQLPAASTIVGIGTDVALVVSLGAMPVTVPDVVGATQAQAEADIVAAGLTTTVTTESSETVLIGTVISQNPLAGVDAPEGSAVALIVSNGPPPEPLPGRRTTTREGTFLRNDTRFRRYG